MASCQAGSGHRSGQDVPLPNEPDDSWHDEHPGRAAASRCERAMPDRPRQSTRPVPRDVLVSHVGRWYRGTLVHQYRDERGQWRAVVRYDTGVMENRVKGCPFSELRPIESAEG